MFLTHFLLAVFTCLFLIKYAPAAKAHRKMEEEEENSTKDAGEEEAEIQQKVPLIDIVFMNGKKRTCTGAIIHDNVVITAGHCFMGAQTGAPYSPPELTASFVVIGTKKKFESGYEQYLPIERVITHPNVKGWSADLALVHTFASMTAEKVGAIMPLADERASTSIEPNVTILSWGPILGDQDVKSLSREEKDVLNGDNESDNSCVSDERNTPSSMPFVEILDALSGENGKGMSGDSKKPSNGGPHPPPHRQHSFENNRERHGKILTFKGATMPILVRGLNEAKAKLEKSVKYQRAGHHHIHKIKGEQTTKALSRYLLFENQEKLSMPILDPPPSPRHRYHKIDSSLDPAGNNDSINNLMEKDGRRRLEPERSNPFEACVRWLDQEPDAKGGSFTDGTHCEVSLPGALPGYNDQPVQRVRGTKSTGRYRNWRRQLGTAQINKLSVETFGFVNAQACKKMIDKVNRGSKITNSDEIICYASDDHYVTDEDSGAPAVRQGQLIAITVGGIESEGDHVAVGMKLSHFCPWIAENLPAGETTLNCWAHPVINDPQEEDTLRSYKNLKNAKQHPSWTMGLDPYD